jgi:hypothetical protein
MLDTLEVNASWLNKAYTLFTAFRASSSVPKTRFGVNSEGESDVRYFLHDTNSITAAGMSIKKEIRFIIKNVMSLIIALEGYINTCSIVAAFWIG